MNGKPRTVKETDRWAVLGKDAIAQWKLADNSGLSGSQAERGHRREGKVVT